MFIGSKYPKNKLFNFEKKNHWLQASQAALTQSTEASRCSEAEIKTLELKVRKASLDVESDLKKFTELEAQVSQLESDAEVCSAAFRSS